MKSENMRIWGEIKSELVRKRIAIDVKVKVKVIFFGPQQKPSRTMRRVSDVRCKRHSFRNTLMCRGHSRDMQLNGDCGLDWLGGCLSLIHI